MGEKLCPKIILEGTRLTMKTDIAFALNEHPRVGGVRKYRYHSPVISAEWCSLTNVPWGRGPINYDPEEEGRALMLGDFFGTMPVLVSPVYFGCPQLCTQVLHGLVDGLKEMRLEPGRDFEIVTFSINPLEKPELAREKKAAYLELLGKPEAASAWHFLSADPARNLAPAEGKDSDRAWHNASVDALTAKIGFRYAYDHEIEQYAHAAGVVVATPEGKVSKYLYGIHFLPPEA